MKLTRLRIVGFKTFVEPTEVHIEPGLTETEFSVVRFKGDEGKAGNVYAGTKAMTAEDIAESIFWATSLPEHVNINKIQLMATTQAIGAFDIYREK